MALLAPQTPKLAGTTILPVAAASGGDTLAPQRRSVLRVRNGGAGLITVTIVAPGDTRFGQAEPDIPVPVAAGAEVAIGPFPRELADPVTGLVSITYSGVATVTVSHESI